MNYSKSTKKNKKMKVNLYYDFGAYPICFDWEDEEGPNVNYLPDDWKSDKELVALNEQVSDMWTSFYIDEPHKKFEFVGPANPEEKQLFKELSEKLIALVYKHADGKYEVIDEITEQIEKL